MKHRRTRVPGLGSYFVRGSGYWIAHYVNGREHRESVAKLLGCAPGATTAALALRCLRQRVRQPPASPRRGAAGRVTVSAVLDAYLARLAAEGGRKSLSDIITECAHLRAALGPLRATVVDRALVGAYVAQARAVGFAPGTLKKRLGYLRAAFYAAKDAGLVRDVPELPKLEGAPPRQGFYDPEDFAARHRHLTGVFADVIECYYLTGWRRDEVLRLVWTQVDRTAGVIRLPDSKTGEGRVVPLNPALAALVARRWDDRATRRWDGRVIVSPWVFHGALGGRLHEDHVYAAWYAAADRAGLPRQGLHDFRRTVARDGVAAGESEKAVMQLTGHKTASTFKRYQITDTRDIARVQVAMADFRARSQPQIDALHTDKKRTRMAGTARKTMRSLNVARRAGRS